jgi:GTP cyclohydrolase IB
MPNEKRYLAEVGIENLPYPIRVISKADVEGQPTVANISIYARILREFEARSIDLFIRILHKHRSIIGTKTLTTNILEYREELRASTVNADFRYPYFIEKSTPVSKEKCLVKYDCTYSVKSPSLDLVPKIFFTIEIPVITSYPVQSDQLPAGSFGQLSKLIIQTQSEKDIYPEDVVQLVDTHSAAVYSYLSEDDQKFLIQKIRSEPKTSVVLLDEIKNELVKNRDLQWFSIRCYNYGMLHSYNTVIGTERSPWIPDMGYDDAI